MQGGGASSSADSFWSSKLGVSESESDCSQPSVLAQLPCHPAPIAGANSTAAHSSTVSTLAAWRVATCFEYAQRAVVLTLYSATWPKERISTTVERQHFLGLLLSLRTRVDSSSSASTPLISAGYLMHVKPHRSAVAMPASHALLVESRARQSSARHELLIALIHNSHPPLCLWWGLADGAGCGRNSRWLRACVQTLSARQQ
jgi:hypothetical protein